MLAPISFDERSYYVRHFTRNGAGKKRRTVTEQSRKNTSAWQNRVCPRAVSLVLIISRLSQSGYFQFAGFVVVFCGGCLDLEGVRDEFEEAFLGELSAEVS